MLIVKNSIVSDDIVDRRFCCDLSQCKGQCCVEGDCGAPLLEEEIPILEQILPQVEPYMTEAGKAVVQSEGVATLNNAAEPHLYPLRVDEYGEFTTVNYHQWDVCRCAVVKGNQEGQPLYEYLREPLVRRFGQDWYDELLLMIELKNKE